MKKIVQHKALIPKITYPNFKTIGKKLIKFEYDGCIDSRYVRYNKEGLGHPDDYPSNEYDVKHNPLIVDEDLFYSTRFGLKRKEFNSLMKEIENVVGIKRNVISYDLYKHEVYVNDKKYDTRKSMNLYAPHSYTSIYEADKLGMFHTYFSGHTGKTEKPFTCDKVLIFLGEKKGS